MAWINRGKKSRRKEVEVIVEELDWTWLLLSLQLDWWIWEMENDTYIALSCCFGFWPISLKGLVLRWMTILWINKISHWSRWTSSGRSSGRWCCSRCQYKKLMYPVEGHICTNILKIRISRPQNKKMPAKMHSPTLILPPPFLIWLVTPLDMLNLVRTP